LFDSPKGKKALKSYMTKASMQYHGDPRKVARKQKRGRGMALVHTNYPSELNAAISGKAGKRSRVGKPVKRETWKGIVRGAKVGVEGVGNVFGGAADAIRGALPGLSRAFAGARHTGTGVSMIGQHTGRAVRPQIRKRPLTSIALAAALGVAGAYGGKKAYDWWNKPTGTTERTVRSGGGGIDEPSFKRRPLNPRRQGPTTREP
jgi:hypothetical protein